MWARTLLSNSRVVDILKQSHWQLYPFLWLRMWYRLTSLCLWTLIWASLVNIQLQLEARFKCLLTLNWVLIILSSLNMTFLLRLSHVESQITLTQSKSLNWDTISVHLSWQMDFISSMKYPFVGIQRRSKFKICQYLLTTIWSILISLSHRTQIWALLANIQRTLKA